MSARYRFIGLVLGGISLLALGYVAARATRPSNAHVVLPQAQDPGGISRVPPETAPRAGVVAERERGESLEARLLDYWGEAWESMRPKYVAAGIELSQSAVAAGFVPWEEARPALEEKVRNYFERDLQARSQAVAFGLLELTEGAAPAKEVLVGLFPEQPDDVVARMAQEAPVQLSDQLFELSLAKDGYMVELENSLDVLLSRDEMTRSPLIGVDSSHARSGGGITRIQVDGRGWSAVAQIEYREWPALLRAYREVESKSRAVLSGLRAMAR